MKYPGDGRCKYCGQPIRWVDDNGHRLALNVAPVAHGGAYVVVGAETSRRIPKAQRAAYGKLYEPHNTKKNCTGWENAQAMKRRQAEDRVMARIDKEKRDALPENVALFSDRRGRR